MLANGDCCKGEFRDSVKSGYGIYYFSNGDRFEGEFYADAMTGYGALFRADGSIEQGIWRNGELVNPL